ncbi:hypothetical protein AOLI_G00232700 [Acnodon oligacanthus]
MFLFQRGSSTRLTHGLDRCLRRSRQRVSEHFCGTSGSRAPAAGTAAGLPGRRSKVNGVTSSNPEPRRATAPSKAETHRRARWFPRLTPLRLCSVHSMALRSRAARVPGPARCSVRVSRRRFTCAGESEPRAGCGSSAAGFFFPPAFG